MFPLRTSQGTPVHLPCFRCAPAPNLAGKTEGGAVGPAGLDTLFRAQREQIMRWVEKTSLGAGADGVCLEGLCPQMEKRRGT